MLNGSPGDTNVKKMAQLPKKTNMTCRKTLSTVTLAHLFIFSPMHQFCMENVNAVIFYNFDLESMLSLSLMTQSMKLAPLGKRRRF